MRTPVGLRKSAWRPESKSRGRERIPRCWRVYEDQSCPAIQHRTAASDVEDDGRRAVTTAVLPSSLPMADHSLDLALTAVDEEFTAGDVTAFVGGEERDRLGDLIRGSRSAQRNERGDGVDVVVQW